MYRGTSLIRNCLLLEPYHRIMSRLLWWCLGGVAVSYERGTPVCISTEALCQDLLISTDEAVPAQRRRSRSCALMCLSRGTRHRSICAVCPPRHSRELDLATQPQNYRGTSFTRNSTPPLDHRRAHALAYCRVLGRGGFLRARYPCTPKSTSTQRSTS